MICCFAPDAESVFPAKQQSPAPRKLAKKDNMIDWAAAGIFRRDGAGLEEQIREWL